MIKKISIFGVIALLMTLFIWSININALAMTYEDGYKPLNENTTYVNEIKINMIDSYDDCNCTTYATGPLYTDRYDNVTIKRVRKVYGDTDTNTITTIFKPYDRGLMTFVLKYNDEIRISVSVIKATNSLFIKETKGIDFNDPTRVEYQSCSKVRLGAPYTSVERDGSFFVFSLDDYPNYEDLALTRNYDVMNVVNITKKVSETPSIEELRLKPITLENGLKIDSANNIVHGGNYVLDENGYIEEGIYNLKVITKYNEIYCAVLYIIEILPEIDKFPGFETSVKKQVSEADIKEQIESYGLTDYDFDAIKYYENFDEPGIYIVKVTYRVKEKEFTVNLPITVNNIGEGKIKILDDSLLKVSYNKELSYLEFENNVDLNYIYLDSYSIDYSNYLANKNTIGEYYVHVRAKDTDNKTYIVTFVVKVVDDIVPEAYINENFNNKISYTKSINIDDIISNVNITDLSKYTITYDQNIKFDSVGQYLITLTIEDEYGNSIDYPIEINIIDDIAPKIIANDITTTNSLQLDENSMKSQIYATDEINGKISSDNIIINDINGYKYNYDQVGIYKFEVIAKDASGNEGHGFFNVIVNEEKAGISTSNDNIISIGRNIKLTAIDIKNYLIDNGFIDAEGEYELVSDYFDSEIIDKNTYDLEVKTKDSVKNYQIVIKESEASYEMSNKSENKTDSNNITLIVTLSIIGILVVSSGVLIFIIYKKRH